MRESKRERREREQRPGLGALPARCKLKSLFFKKKLKKNPTLTFNNKIYAVQRIDVKRISKMVRREGGEEKTSRVFGIHARAMQVSRQPKVAHFNVPRLTHCHSHIYIECEKSN